jgi:hypothetical protein
MSQNWGYILRSLFLKKQLGIKFDIEDHPELTDYLKKNPHFIDASWKVFYAKNKMIEKLDEVLN